MDDLTPHHWGADDQKGPAMTDLDELERLLAKATPGEWSYRPDEYDDWGVVKSQPREVGSYEPPLIMRGLIGQFRDPDLRDDKVLDEYRRSGTDPWMGNAALIVALRNAAPAMIAELKALRRATAMNELIASTADEYDPQAIAKEAPDAD